jgi:NAD(P)-dependent dehydrogenase (short-subunit alcohol dehydrogenase family)
VNSKKEFEDKRILVTGGTRGIGAAIVNRFKGQGGQVLTTGRSVSSNNSEDAVICADLSTREGIDRLVAAVMDRFDALDIMIHNAGGSAARGGGAMVLSDDDWQKAFDINLFAAVRLDRAFLPSMLKQRSGVIIHISSIQRTYRCTTQPWRTQPRKQHSPITARVYQRNLVPKEFASTRLRLDILRLMPLRAWSTRSPNEPVLVRLLRDNRSWMRLEAFR